MDEHEQNNHRVAFELDLVAGALLSLAYFSAASR